MSVLLALKSRPLSFYIVATFLLAFLQACGYTPDLAVKKDSERNARDAISRRDYTLAARIYEAAAAKYSDPSDYDVKADLLSSAALWHAFAGDDASAIRSLNECTRLKKTITSKVAVESCEEARMELRTRTGLYANVPRGSSISGGNATNGPAEVVAKSPPLTSPSGSSRENRGTTQQRQNNAINGGAVPSRGAVKGDANPVIAAGPSNSGLPGAKTKAYLAAVTTQTGNLIYGTPDGLACLSRSRVQDDRPSDVYELTCPAIVWMCWLSTPPGHSGQYGMCNQLNGSISPGSRGPGPYHGQARVLLPREGKASIFVAGWNQCGAIGNWVFPVPDGWIAYCDFTTQNLQVDANNGTAQKLQALWKQRWGIN